jgi:hypothetical protein
MNEHGILSSEQNATPKKPGTKMLLTLVILGIGFALLIALNMN